ncbi:hypothetical protein [Candidatus Phytoplasma sp. AldY-WA1]|uniref:hypothetical protein n=1 Tax=Candidatus Phytoplasma sp. AldY-WA1 TaxID=2852100 RepID=UPI00254FA2BF|nr:hypothetical protein [Candidatus Phytoplasma sp. AldY-WA1]
MAKLLNFSINEYNSDGTKTIKEYNPDGTLQKSQNITPIESLQKWQNTTPDGTVKTNIKRLI